MLWGCWHGVLSQETKACCCSRGNRMTLLRTKRDKNKAKIMLLGLGTFVTQPFQYIIFSWNPQRAPYHLPTPLPRLSAHLLPCEQQGPPISPSLVGPLLQVLSAAQALRAVRLVLSVQDLPKAWRTDAKICGTRPGREGRRR